MPLGQEQAGAAAYCGVGARLGAGAAAALGRRRDERGQVAAGVVHPHHEGPKLGVADHRDRARVYRDALESVEVHAEGVGDDRLDDVAVRDDGVDRLGNFGAGEARVPVAHRADGPGTHVGERLALGAGEGGGARVRLHHLPERFLGQRLERLVGPVAVTALPHPLVDVQRRERLAAREDRLGGLPGALERTGHHRGQGYDGQPRGGGRGLLAPLVVEVDAGRPAGEDAAGIGGGPAVPDQDDGGHVPTLRALAASG
jgi:hypothetical protein